MNRWIIIALVVVAAVALGVAFIVRGPRKATTNRAVSMASPAPARSTEPAPDLNALLTAADPEQGRLLFMQCSACHSLQAGARNGVGPTLAGLFGRRAGRVPGYDYSPMMQVANFVWTPEVLDHWLRDPGFLPDSRMNFLPLPRPEDRAHLIAYLQQQTAIRLPPPAN